MPIYYLNNKRYNIPDDVVKDFEKAHPDATIPYSAEGNVYDIPVYKRDKFLKKYPEASPYSDNQPKNSQPYTHQYDEDMNLVGGTAYDEMKKNGELGDDTQGSYQYDPKVQKHILENKPDMFKPKTVDVYGAHDKDKSEFDLMNEGKLYQMKAMRAASTIGEQLNERIKANEEALNEARKKQAEGNLQPSSNNRGRYSSVGLGGTIKERQEAYEKSYGKSPSRVEQTNMDDDVANLLAEQEYLKESKKVLDAAKNDAGFFQGMKDAIDASYLSFGLTDKLSAERIDTVQKKLSSGEALSDSEQSLLTSLGLQQMVNEQYNDLLGRWYKAGMVTAEMAPFMAEMAVNPLSGLGKSAMKFTVKKFGEKGAKAIAAKVLSRTIGDVAGAAGMAATTSMAGVTADAMARQRGYVKTDLDEKQGTIKGVGFEGGEDASDAWRKAFASRTIENWSEMVGEYFSPIGKAVGKGFTKAFNKMGLSKVNDFIDNINSSEWVKLLDDFSERTQWNGPLGEFAEEQVGMVANAALVGDTKWSDIADLDQQLDVALGVGVFGTVMSLLRIGGYRTPKYRARKAVEGADKEGAKLYGEELWANVKETIGLSSDEELGKNLAELIAATGANQEQAEAAFKYANALKAQQAVNTVKEKAKIDMPGDMEVEAEAAYDEGSELQTPWEKHEVKRAVDRAEAALGVGSENSDEQLFAQMVMNGAETPVATINAMAEQGYSDEQIQKAKDYYSAMNRMNGMTDALLDEVDSQIESANAEVDANTNKNNGSVTKVMLRDGSWGYVVEGTVVHGEKGIVDVNNSDDTVMVRLENGEVKMMNPNKDLYAVAWIDSPEKVKEEINVVLREKLIDQAIGEIDWNPATPNPKVGDSFEMGGVPVTIVSHDGNGGMFVVPTEEYQSAVGSEQKMQQLIAKAQQQQPIPASEYKNWASAQLDAQEDAQAMVPQEAETATISEGLQPVAEGVASGEELSPVEEKRPMTEDEAASFIFQMERNAVEAPEIELTPENWIAEFGEDGFVETPIGQVKFGQSQYLKLQQMGRRGKLGMIKPTLTEPDVIIEDKRPSKDGSEERDFSYVFIKAFTGKDGKRMYYFTSVTIRKDGSEVVISNQEKSLNKISRLLQGGNVVWTNSLFSSHPTTRIEESVPLNDSNKPTSTDNQSAWLGINSSELSTNKDSDNNVQSQENKDKPLHEREKEDVFRELGEKYGEKMPHKVEVTAKALADDLAKAQKKLDKAIEEYDNAPIGREEKAEKARDKAQEEFDAIKREAEFWAALDKEIKDAQTSPGDEVAEEILSMEEPLNGEEFAAQMLANGNIKLLQDSFASETGFGKEEAKKYFGLFASSDKGGMTIQQAGERLMEADRENGTNFFDQNDPNAGRNAIIQVLGMAKTKKDLANILPNNRAEQARKEKEAEFRAYESWVEENFHMSVADFEAYEEVIARDLSERGLSETEYQEFMSTFVDETFNKAEDEQQGIIAESEGSSEVLPGTQPLQTEGVGRVEERPEKTDGGIVGENGAVPEGASGSEVEDSGAVEEAQEVLDNIKKARKEVDTNPTEAQKEAGNYKKGHIKIDGFDITIENPKGGVRSGTDKNGKKWSITMNNDYGYIRGTEAVDGDHIDVFLSSFPTQGSVFVVDQSNEDGSFDESKVMYGFSSLEEARAAYLSNYEQGWESRIMAITEVSKEEFKKWIDSSHRKTKAFVEYKTIKTVSGQSSEVRKPQIADVFAAAEKIDAEEKRRRPLRARANEWAKALGVKVTFLESIDEVDAVTRAQIEASNAKGDAVPGWVARNGEVFLFMPDLRNLKDIDDTYIHEVVAHIGMEKLLGKERFGKLCDKVWEMMPQSEKDYYMSYPGVKNHRMAADEYIAHLSESLNLTPEQQGIWDKIVQFFRELFDQKLNGILSKSNITNDDIANLIRASYANLKSGAAESVVGEGNRFSAKKKRALETASVSRGKHQPTVVSSADGANILNNLDNLAKEYEEKSSQSKTFLGDVSKAIGARKQGSGSQYATFETVNGNVVTIRLADHNATVSNFDNRDENEGISIVVSAKDNNGITNDGDAHIVEYFYDSIDLRRADGKPLAEIVKSIKQSLYSGEFKDTTGLAERQEVNPSRFRISNRNQEIFVSNAQKAVEGIKQEKGTPQQWLAMIEKNGGLKAGEDKWLGLSDWLKGLDKKSVTKDEILDFIGENKIQIEEVKYSDEATYGSDVINSNPEAREVFEQMQEDYTRILSEEKGKVGDNWKAYVNASERLNEKYPKSDTSFDVDRNDILRVKRGMERQALESLGIAVDKPINATRLNYTTKGLVNNTEIALVVPTIESWNQDDEIHFGDAVEGRAIAWIRFGETTSPQADFEKAAREADDALTAYQNELADKYIEDGGSGDPTEYLDMMNEEEIKKMRELSGKMIETRDEANANQVRVLVIDEIQSKRHQEGREKGYKSKEIADLLKETEELQDKLYNEGLTEEEYERNREIRRRLEELSPGGGGYSNIPEAPFEKNWSELAFKRMLRYAAENGFDKVAWTKGAQQAERYSLSNVIDSISISKSRKEDGKYHVTSWDKETMPIGVASGNKNPEELRELFGKEIAQSLIEGVDNLEEGSDTFTFEGADLEVGGEGMKGFYDKMLPSFVNKYVKKWGTKVQDIELPNVEEAGRIMHSVDVTDTMKESVMEGQTMFRIVDNEKQKQIDKEYVDAVHEGDFGKAVGLFREYVLSKAEEYGVVPIDYAVGYRGHSHSSIAKKVKEENPDAISEAAYQMSKRVPKGSILVPMPSRSGKATYTIKLAEAIAKATDSEVRDVLRGEERMSVYEAKKKGLKINSRDLGLYVTEKLPKDKNVIIIDNVIDRGITALAAVEAVNGGSVLAYAFTKGSKDRVVPLKLSDPITYDDNLRIIPLSERFNANTDDLRFRVLRDPAVDYISQAEDVVEVPRGEVMYTMNNIAPQLYKTSGRFMRQLYKYGTLGRVLKGEYAEIDQIKAKQEYDHAKPILEEYLNELVWMKYQATEAAQEVINDVISDVEYAMQYYKDLSLGKDVWRTNVSPRFRISDYGKQVKAEVDKVTSKYNSKDVMFFDSEMTDEEISSIHPDLTREDVMPLFENNVLGGYSSRMDNISIFANNVPIDNVEDTIFHENVHALLQNGQSIIDAFAENALERFPKNVKRIQERGYDEEEVAEELLVRLVAKAMVYGIFDDVAYNLPESEFENLKKLLKDFGYEYEQEVKSRSLEEGRRGTPTLLGGEEVFEARRVRQDSGRQKEERRARKEELGKLFDQVADMGLDGVLGNRYYGKLLMDIYQEMPLDVRRYVSASAINQYGGNFVPAMSDYLNVKATAEIWGKVVGFVRDVLRKVGFDLELNQADVKYMLWRSQKPMKKYSALDVAEDIDARRKFGVDGDSGVRFSVKNADPFDPSDKRNEIVKEYDAFLKKGKFNFIEAFQDRMYSVKVFMDMIVGVTGKKVRDFENAYEAENQLGSINKPAEEKYLKNFYKPLVEAVKTLSEKYGREAVERYIYCKSGLERNEVLRQRDADEAFNVAKEELDDKLAKGQLTQPQYDALLQQAEDQRQQTLSEDVDYSGIRGMLFNLKAHAINKEYEEGRIDKSTRDTRLANLEANRKNVVQDWKQFAENEVTAIESRASSAELKDLWKKINAATNETLRMDYESGMIDKATYDAEKNMMKYYVPLRNWADTTAEEMYEYRSELVRPVSSNQKRAKGRESQADNPIATIALMAQNAIVRGNRNKVKQKFYAFVANRETGLASVRDVWYVKDPATDTWEAKYADTTNASDAAEFAQILDDFETDMQLLESQGLAYKGKLPLGMKFRASRKQKQSHVVPVMINGKEYAVYVNGNPRPAQAMNGETNSEAANASAWYDKIKRIYGAGLTSWNPDFIIPNMIRDGIHASTMTFLDAGPIAAARFALNGPRAFGQVFAMISGFGKGLVNPQNQAYFEEFVANGGETGYTAIHTLEDYKKEYDKMMNELKGLKGNFLKKGFQGIAKFLEATNRIFEDVNRFNAYVSARESGESIMRSISAAKNITVNFNRKGALSANNTAFGTIANAMSKWILFFNPAVQGLAQLVTKTKVNPKRAAAMASSILASGFFMPMLNEMLVAANGGDDEDDYWNQSDFKRRNNWLLFTGDGYASVPLPPVLRELYGIGDIIYGSITGHITPQRAVMDMARQVQSAVGFVNLIPEASQEPDMVTWAKGFAPDIAAPVLDVISNTNFMGRPIAKWTDFNEYEPEYERVYKGVSPQWVELSKLLNKVGGDEGRRSDVWGNFINPAMMEHLITSYGGGIGKTINNLVGMAIDIAEGDTENLDPFRKSPIVPRFYTPVDEKSAVPGINRKYYDYDYRYNVAKKALKNYQEGVASKEHPEYQKYIDEMKENGEIRFMNYFKSMSKQIKDIQNRIKENPRNKKELEEKLIEMKAQVSVKCTEILK